MPPPKSEADHIYLLLSILEHTEGKTNWNEIAKVTGIYKDGKFVRQAFNSIKTKYGSGTSVAASSNSDTPKKTATAPSTSKSTPRKRGKASDESVSPSKKIKTKTTDQTGENELAGDVELKNEAA